MTKAFNLWKTGILTDSDLVGVILATKGAAQPAIPLAPGEGAGAE
eukprot:gene31370-35827_t